MTMIEALSSIRQELERAERKFPTFPVDPIHAAAIVQEEAGELVQAALQHTYESGGFAAMYSEAMQVGAMALRFLIHLDSMKRCPSEQIRSAGLQPLTAKAQNEPCQNGDEGAAAHFGHLA